MSGLELHYRNNLFLCRPGGGNDTYRGYLHPVMAQKCRVWYYIDRSACCKSPLPFRFKSNVSNPYAKRSLMQVVLGENVDVTWTRRTASVTCLCVFLLLTTTTVFSSPCGQCMTECWNISLTHWVAFSRFLPSAQFSAGKQEQGSICLCKNYWEDVPTRCPH